MSSKKNYDVLVIGSGATGGFAAKELTEKGFNVIVLEAGPALDESSFHKKKSKAKGIGATPRIIAGLTGQHIQARASFFSPDQRFLFVNDWKNPYSYPSDDFFLWIRSRNVGGRFMSWGRVALRISDYAFKSATYEGVGEDWPISYNDLAPYYDKVVSLFPVLIKKTFNTRGNTSQAGSFITIILILLLAIIKSSDWLYLLVLLYLAAGFILYKTFCNIYPKKKYILVEKLMKS